MEIQNKILEYKLEAAKNDEDVEADDEDDAEESIVKDEKSEEKEGILSQYRYRPRFEHLMPVVLSPRHSYNRSLERPRYCYNSIFGRKRKRIYRSSNYIKSEESQYYES